MKRVARLPPERQAEEYAQRARTDRDCARAGRWLARAEKALTAAYRAHAPARKTAEAEWLINSAHGLLHLRCGR